MMKKIKIGAVSLTIEAGATSGTKATDQGEKDYSDGGVEDFLLKLFRSKNPHKKVEDILRNNPSWPQLYHLSFARHNLLNWYPFKQTDSVLEIGAGCGALTGLFTASCGHVTALELTKRRATIIAERFRDAKNLDVVVANIMNWRTEKKYDYVIISGVLEYSGQFVDDETPYESFLKKAASYLKPDGCLILAIENKLGLKYWAGSREDHTWHFFDSIEDYPRQATKVRTFSRHELVELLSGVGLPNQNFYYPVPDMKLPSEVFSDMYLPSLDHPINPRSLPAPAFDAPRKHVFNELNATNSVIKAELFRDMANSFIVFARRKK